VLDVEEEHVVDELHHFLENQDAHEQEEAQANQPQVADARRQLGGLLEKDRGDEAEELGREGVDVLQGGVGRAEGAGEEVGEENEQEKEEKME
jgi:hypothetical protein